jgi:putative redox protein
MQPSLLVGHYLGGAAVLKAASDMPNIKAVFTLGAPFDPEHVTHNFADSLPLIIRNGVAQVSLGGRPFRISNDFLENVAKGKLTPAISTLYAALLVLHSPRYATVSIDNASKIFLAA